MSSPDFQAAGLDPTAIPENRSGRITHAQGQEFLDRQRRQDRSYYAMAAMMLVVVAIIGQDLIRKNPPSNWIVPIAILLLPIVLVVFLIRSLSSEVKQDVADGRVLSLEGAGETSMVRGRRNVSYILTINGERLRVTGKVYTLLESSRTYRAYYLPRTQQVVNLEVLR
jgi:hypothetical protein